MKKKTVLARLAYILPMTALAGLLVTGALYMGAFSSAGSSEAACGGRITYRDCGWNRHEHKTKTRITVTRTITTQTADATQPEF